MDLNEAGLTSGIERDERLLPIGMHPSGRGYPMKIVLLRHGESQSVARSDEAICPADDRNPLTPDGTAQVAAFAARATKALNRPRVSSSDMRRARESADVIAGRLGTGVEYWPELREVLSIDREEAFENLHRRLSEFWERFYLGDATDDLVVRARRNAEGLRARISEQEGNASDLILVSHGGMIEVLMAGLFTGYARVGYTVEYRLQPGAFHLLELTTNNGRIRHLRLHGANCSAFPPLR